MGEFVRDNASLGELRSQGRPEYCRSGGHVTCVHKEGDEMERKDRIFFLYWTRSSTSSHQKCKAVFILGFMLIVLQQKKIKKKPKINLKHNKYTYFFDVITCRLSRSK